MIPIRDENPNNEMPYVTYGLLGINVLVWIFVQGAGFVGSAFAVACASAKNNNKYIFEVSIVEQEHQNKLIGQINKGIFPFKTNDKKLPKLIKHHINRNLSCSHDVNEYEKAEIIISCISFNCESRNRRKNEQFNSNGR